MIFTPNALLPTQHTEPAEPAYKTLWWHVMGQAFNDVNKRSVNAAEAQKLARAALAWATEPDTGFEQVCEFLSLDVASVRAAFISAGGRALTDPARAALPRRVVR